jgi:hypothetical protein
VKRFGLLDGSVVIQCGRALDWVFVYVVYVFFQIEFFFVFGVKRLANSTGEERRGRGGGLQGCSIVVMF